MEKVEDELIESDENLIYRYNGERFTGISCGHCLNGRLSSEKSFVDGLQDGWSREWSEDGMLLAESYYQKGWEVGWYKQRVARPRQAKVGEEA